MTMEEHRQMVRELIKIRQGMEEEINQLRCYSKKLCKVVDNLYKIESQLKTVYDRLV